MLLFGLKNCDKCRKAKKNYGLNEMFETFGDSLLNKSSTTWRGLSEAERGDAPIALIRRHPTLMKRPLIVHGDGTLTLGEIAA
ncbi:MAG: arsenate reductase [Rhodobacteraceae bacterium]|nr:arsenate reductase [Paracoccaceae bacterium]